MMGKRGTILLMVWAVSLVCGCDPVTIHKVTSTIFDGVPSMPPAEQYCREYHENKLTEESEAAKKKQLIELAGKSSVHPPYAEKRCDDCHNKDKVDGLIAPRQQICFVCHPDIVKKAFVHGPAATGSCLECHDPHSTPNEALLKNEKKVLCGTCHREKRLSAAMHDGVAAKGMICTDCHDPHGGNSPYFLK